MKLLPKARTADIVIQYLPNEILIYDLKIDKAYCLNETLAKVYQSCDGKTALAELKRKSNFSDDLIHFALAELERENLLEQSPLDAAYFAGMTRREIIRRVGLASMIALPVIASLTAPISANAASGGSLYRACETDNQCGSDAPYCTTEAGTTSKRCCRSFYAESSNGGETITKNIGSTACVDCFKTLIGYCCSARITNTAINERSCNETVPPYSCTATCA